MVIGERGGDDEGIEERKGDLLARSFFCPLKKVYKSRKLAVRGLQKIHINVSSFIFIY
jgi:hypothetical protein